VERQLRDQKVQLPPREVLEKQLLERMITDRVQLQYAKETGLRISDIELDAALRRIAEGNRLALQDFRAALERDGIAWAKFREEIRDEHDVHFHTTNSSLEHDHFQLFDQDRNHI
jgi:peptidyl-prolyl cis-trans isomerase SurA